jgi:phenylacetate-coenzyme A ligase PaaK-like adenylate-forming protein
MDREIKLKGDKVAQIPSIKDKALRINLNENIYGTFAGAGRNCKTFFRSGGSSGTIGKQCLPMTKILVMRYTV